MTDQIRFKKQMIDMSLKHLGRSILVALLYVLIDFMMLMQAFNVMV